MNTTTFEITDGTLSVEITVTEMADGSLKFDLQVLDGGLIGDLNGLFFDLNEGADGEADDILASSLQVTSDNIVPNEAEGTFSYDVSETNINADSVTKVDSYNNVNGEVAKEDGKFDVGVQFGSQGMAEDDIQMTSFTLSSTERALTLDDILGQDFAVRLTSVGEEGGDRDGSLKISGSSPEEPDAPEDPGVIDDPAGPSNLAVDNTMTVTSNETFSFFELPDLLDDADGNPEEFDFTLLENDTTEGTPYTGVVTGVNGQALTAGTEYIGSNGGLLKVNEDGSVDFSANNEFGHLEGDQTALTQFTYEIEGGSTAFLTVEVTAFDPNGGGTGDDLFL